MSTYDLTLHATDAWELASQLRTVADRVSKVEAGCLPKAGEEKALVFDGNTIGAISQPGIVPPSAESSVDRTVLTGDASLMHRVSESQSAIINLLQDDLSGLQELNDHHRNGLLLALDELARGLSFRAEFLEELTQGGE